MDRDALAELSREQLIELVLGLAAEVAELKAQLGQPPKTPGNSSVPPSVGFKANRAERRRRRGKRRGHPGTSRRRHAFVSRNGAGRELQAGKSPRAAMSCGPGKRQIW